VEHSTKILSGHIPEEMERCRLLLRRGTCIELPHDSADLIGGKGGVAGREYIIAGQIIIVLSTYHARWCGLDLFWWQLSSCWLGRLIIIIIIIITTH